MRGLVGHSDNSKLGKLMQALTALGGIASLALLVGVFVWGYQVNQIATHGIPVVEPTRTVFREKPKVPGGFQSPHLGLSVNVVSGELPDEPLERDNVGYAPPNVGLRGD